MLLAGGQLLPDFDVELRLPLSTVALDVCVCSFRMSFAGFKLPELFRQGTISSTTINNLTVEAAQAQPGWGFVEAHEFWRWFAGVQRVMLKRLPGSLKPEAHAVARLMLSAQVMHSCAQNGIYQIEGVAVLVMQAV